LLQRVDILCVAVWIWLYVTGAPKRGHNLMTAIIYCMQNVMLLISR